MTLNTRRDTASRQRFALAFAVAAVADLVSGFATVAPPLQWLVDAVTALTLFLLLGRRWAILPGLVAEAVPGLAMFPFWILVVASIAAWGRIGRPADAGQAPHDAGPQAPRSRPGASPDSRR